MTFTVTYRGADGALREERLEAAGRGECFAQCRARGIAPLSVKEGDVVSRSGRGDERGKNGRIDHVGGKSRVVAYVLSAAFVALIGGGVWWWLGRDQARPSPKPVAPKKAAVPKEVKPAVAPMPKPKTAMSDATNIAITIAAQDAVPPPAVPVATTNPAENVRVITNRYHRARGHKMPFKHRSENELAILLTLPLGTMFLGSPHYDRRFIDDLKRSFDEPIETAEDDSEETRLLKKAVTETKADLKRQMDAGEDIVAILTETRAELQRLGMYKMQLQHELKKLSRDPGNTAQDIEDFTQAANELLEQRGIAPLKVSPFTKRLLENRPDKDSEKKEEK